MSRRVSCGVVLSMVLCAGLVFASTATLADFQNNAQRAADKCAAYHDHLGGALDDL